MSFPNQGQGLSSSAPSMLGGQKRPNRIQVKKAPMNAVPGRGPSLMGGGGMAVGGLRAPNGMPRNPRAARSALTAGMRG